MGVQVPSPAPLMNLLELIYEFFFLQESNDALELRNTNLKNENSKLKKELNNIKEQFDKIKNKLNDLYHFIINKMYADKEKRDKYYPVVYELYGKNILNKVQMSGILVSKHRSAKIDNESKSIDDDMKL